MKLDYKWLSNLAMKGDDDHRKAVTIITEMHRHINYLENELVDVKRERYEYVKENRFLLRTIEDLKHV